VATFGQHAPTDDYASRDVREAVLSMLALAPAGLAAGRRRRTIQRHAWSDRLGAARVRRVDSAHRHTAGLLASRYQDRCVASVVTGTARRAV